MGNLKCFSENQTNYTSIKDQFKNKILLIGLRKNEKLKELNSILQCLCHINSLVNYFKYEFDEIKEMKYYKLYHKQDQCLSDSFKDIIEKIWPNDPTNRKSKNISKIYDKKDSNEFLEKIYRINPDYNENQEFLINFILMRLHKELHNIEKPYQMNIVMAETDKNIALNNYRNDFEEYQTQISKDFFGIFYTLTNCLNCRNNFYNFQPYIYNIFSLDDIFNYKVQTSDNKMNQLYINKAPDFSSVNINDCLYYEIRLKNNVQTCKKCSIMTNCEIQNIIYEAPTILIFIINNKININNIKLLIEERINIGFMVENKKKIIYNLIGIIYNNFENNFSTFCKNPIDKKWYNYVDENVSDSDFQNISLNGNPYILFYELSRG